MSTLFAPDFTLPAPSSWVQVTRVDNCLDLIHSEQMSTTCYKKAVTHTEMYTGAVRNGLLTVHHQSLAKHRPRIIPHPVSWASTQPSHAAAGHRLKTLQISFHTGIFMSMSECSCSSLLACKLLSTLLFILRIHVVLISTQKSYHYRVKSL